jgi:hypothetical protein
MIFREIAPEINKRLSIKRNSTDIPVTLNMPEHMFKKISGKLNDILMELYNENREHDLKMTDIILALDSHFDYAYLVDTLLDKKILSILKTELKDKLVIKNVKKKNFK